MNYKEFRELARRILNDEFGIDVDNFNDYQLKTIINLLQIERQKRRGETSFINNLREAGL